MDDRIGSRHRCFGDIGDARWRDSDSVVEANKFEEPSHPIREIHDQQLVASTL